MPRSFVALVPGEGEVINCILPAKDLATIEAIAAVTGKRTDRVGLIRASGRGGTSGIGVTTYFDGGLARPS